MTLKNKSTVQGILTTMEQGKTWIAVIFGVTSALVFLSQIVEVLAQPISGSNLSANLTGSSSPSNTINSSNVAMNDSIKNAFNSLKNTFGSIFVK